MRKNFLVSILVLTTLMCLCLSSPQAQADEPPTQEHQLAFPVDYSVLKLGPIDGGQPMITVKIDDVQSATLLVDTGTTSSIISSELAKQMNLHLAPSIAADGTPVSWRGKQAMTTKISVLQVGQIRFTGAALVVLDAKDISLSPTGHDAVPYQGILGADLLEQFAVILDSSNHKIIFCTPGNLSLNQAGLMGFTQPTVLPMANVDSSKWFVPVQFVNSGLKGNEDLLLDTGSDGTDVSEQLGKKIGLKAGRQRGSKNAYGVEAVTISTTDELSLGNLTLRSFPLTVRPVSEQLPPTLGMDIMSKYRVLMDFPGKKMYLQPNPATIPAITVGPAPAVPPAVSPAPAK